MMSTTEEEAPITATEPPTTRDSWWRRKKRVWIGAVALAILILIITISVSARPKSVWNELTVASSSLDARFAKLTGTWDDRLIVMGYTNEGSTFVESYKRTDKGRQSYDKMSDFTVEGIASSMTVAHAGHIIVLAIENPIEFLIYERKVENWGLVGQISLEQIGLSAEDGYTHPTVMLSADGNILALGVQGDAAGITVLEKSVGGAIGGQWDRMGQPLLNTNQQDHGHFNTFSAMSADGLVLAVASEVNKLSLYRFGGLKYDLYASYDESPRVGQGSLALSEDGLVHAVGSYQGFKDGTGQLHVTNDQWHWFLDDGNHEGAEVDLLRTSIETALSASGEYVVIGRYPLRTEGQSEQKATIQVYEFDPIDNEWTSRSPPFGGKASSNRRGSVDLSGDGSLVATVMNGDVYVYEYKAKN